MTVVHFTHTAVRVAMVIFIVVFNFIYIHEAVLMFAFLLMCVGVIYSQLDRILWACLPEYRWLWLDNV